MSTFKLGVASLALVLACAVPWEGATGAGDAGAAMPDNDAVTWTTPIIEAPRLEHHRFYSKAAKAWVSFHIFKPRVYDIKSDTSFPVVYWLHGRSGVPERLGQFVEYLDKTIRKRKIPPMLVVFPSGMPENMWIDSQDGDMPMETIVIKELIPHIDEHYRTIATRRGRVIEGFSMGGYGAARLGLKYSEMFAAVSVLGAGPLQQEFAEFGTRGMPLVRQRTMEKVYGNDQGFFVENSPWTLASRHAESVRRNDPEIRIVVGDRDRMLANNRAFSARLTELDIRHRLIVLPGVGHRTGEVINGLGPSNWAFYRGVFGRGAQDD